MNDFPFLADGGEMGELTRRYDWSKTALGPPHQWSTSLRTLVRMMLTSRFPMLIFWGPELTTFYNDAFRPSLGNNGKHPGSLGQRGEESWAESWPVIGPMITNIMGGGEAVWFEDQKLPIYRDGVVGYAYWTYSFSPLTDDSGAVSGVLVTCSETTTAVESLTQLQQTNQRLEQTVEQNQRLLEQQQTAQQQLQASLQYLLILFEQAPVGIALMSSEQLIFQTANPFYGQLVGRKPDELIDKPLLEALPELVGQGFDDLLNNVITTGQPYVANEVRVDLVRTGRPETIYVNLVYQPRREANDRVSGILVVATDVTAQVATRQQIEAQAAQLERLLENTPDVITRWDTNCQLLYANSAFVDKTSQALVGLLGKTNREMGQPDSIAGPYMACLQRVLATGQSQEHVNAFPTAEGEVFFQSRLVPEFSSQGDVESVLAIARDITRQREDQQALEESRAALQNAIELAELGTWTMDVGTGATQLSQRHAELFGLEQAFLPFEQAFVIVHPDDRERVRAAFEAAMQPGSAGHYQAEYRIIHGTTGQHRYVRARGETYFDEQGQPVSISGTTQDVTLEREAQLALENQVQQRTQELQLANQDLQRSNDNLQQFAYVASHDLQEPLRKIQSFSSLLMEQEADRLSETGHNYLQRISSAGSRMSTLIKDLLTYSRISTRQQAFGMISLEAVVDQVLSTLDWMITERQARIHLDVLPVVNGDELQLSQLFQNLLSNAIKFTPAGQSPRIQITCFKRERSELPPDVNPVSNSRHFIQISVHDEGIGFDKKYLDRIFQVFQRLHGKNEYPGTGVGLAICQRVIENHGGAITADSQPGQGATFCVYLPA